MVGLRREPVRLARLPAAEGEVRALRVANAAAGAGPRGPVPEGLARRGRTVGEEHRRFFPAAGGRIDGEARARKRPSTRCDYERCATGSRSAFCGRWRSTGCAPWSDPPPREARTRRRGRRSLPPPGRAASARWRTTRSASGWMCRSGSGSSATRWTASAKRPPFRRKPAEPVRLTFAELQRQLDEWEEPLTGPV